MLEAKNLVKIYKPKKGVPVKALDSVSIRFPEKGMVFLLGKSGSGKSTLLNVLGGLDRYNSGEILIKGKSSRSFRQKHFDSYRNTYVGFIFQEYNILDEFSVGANVALAIQLQGRKATNEAINSILKEVDLEGYGNRKPNELSGGQKQRVAIARALVKSPEIIMADEPTGALDSVTGRQVLDTLKKLSREKLVIVVSHDREFAEKYADRIVELADGRIISDVEFLAEGSKEEREAEGILYEGNTLTIPEAYELTEEDRLKINEYIRALRSGKVSLTVAGETKKAGRQSVSTDESRIPLLNDSDFKLIKSRLPMRYAFKMGASGLKYKKFRLVMTVLLSCIAFGLFGLADTFGAFDYVTSCTQSLIDSNIDYASFSKAVKQVYDYGDGESYFFSTYMTRFTKEEIDELNRSTSLVTRGVYTPSADDGVMDINSYFCDIDVYKSEYGIYSTSANGYIEVDSSFLDSVGATLLYGELPDGSKDEIAVSAYLAESFVTFGYFDYDAFERGETQDKGEGVKLSSAKDLIGKTLFNKTVVGIIDTGVDLERYKPAFEDDPDMTAADMILQYALMSEFDKLRNYSLACILMTGNGYIENMMSTAAPVYPTSDGVELHDPDMFYGNYFSYLGDLSAMGDGSLEYIAEVADPEKSIALPRYVAIDIANNLLYNGVFGDDMYKEYTEDELLDMLAGVSLNLSSYETVSSAEGWLIHEQVTLDGYRVVAVFDSETVGDNVILCHRSLIDRWCRIADGEFVMALGAMPTDRDVLRDLVAYSDAEHGDIRYDMNNAVVFELSAVRDMAEKIAPIFLYIGLGFALFASLMLSNFITMSITNKKREIGILRAIGSRGNDVFRIFFSESFIIAMINFLLTSVGLVAVVTLINSALRSSTGLLITILNVGPRQILLELAVSLLVAAVASFIPVKRIASKKPIDAIRDR